MLQCYLFLPLFSQSLPPNKTHFFTNIQNKLITPTKHTSVVLPLLSSNDDTVGKGPTLRVSSLINKTIQEWNKKNSQGQFY